MKFLSIILLLITSLTTQAQLTDTLLWKDYNLYGNYELNSQITCVSFGNTPETEFIIEGKYYCPSNLSFSENYISLTPLVDTCEHLQPLHFEINSLIERTEKDDQILNLGFKTSSEQYDGNINFYIYFRESSPTIQSFNTSDQTWSTVEQEPHISSVGIVWKYWIGDIQYTISF